MPSAKKYKLLAAPNGEKKACAFFSSPAGCRNGDNCAFLHGSAETDPIVPEVSETASMISSESEGEISIQQKQDDPFLSPEATKAMKKTDTENSKQQSKKKKRKAPRDDDGDDLFANPKGNKTPTPKKSNDQTPNKQIKKQKTAESSDNVRAVKEGPVSNKGGSFRSLVSNLPVVSFSTTSGIVHQNEPPSQPKESESKATPSKKGSKYPLPTSSSVGRKWVKAVQKTRGHEKYENSFNFTKYKELDDKAGIQSEWIKAKPFGKWCASNPQAIAIDCEMCETQDPLSGNKNHKALCRVSIVNAENTEEVLLDTLVKPAWPVTDYRTRINGIKKEHLDRVEFTLRHAQAFMMALCSEETVIVGHALHNDLAALNMEHHCNADSSYLFYAKDSRSATVSLKDLVSGIFKCVMPETHDSVNDARKALECVFHWVEKDGNVEDIERSYRDKKNQLFVHRIPKQCKAQSLTTMFIKHTDIQPSDVDEIEFSGNLGKTHVKFKSPRHAVLAFDSLEGTAEPDKSGRLQKKVYLRNGDYVRIRKMAYENSRNSNSNSSTPSKTSTPSKK